MCRNKSVRSTINIFCESTNRDEAISSTNLNVYIFQEKITIVLEWNRVISTRDKNSTKFCINQIENNLSCINWLIIINKYSQFPIKDLEEDDIVIGACTLDLPFDGETPLNNTVLHDKM